MSTLPLVYESPRPEGGGAVLLELDAVEDLGHHVGDHVGSVTVLDGNDRPALLTGVVQADAEVLRVAGCHWVGRDVDGWLSGWLSSKIVVGAQSMPISERSWQRYMLSSVKWCVSN